MGTYGAIRIGIRGPVYLPITWTCTIPLVFELCITNNYTAKARQNSLHYAWYTNGEYNHRVQFSQTTTGHVAEQQLGSPESFGHLTSGYRMASTREPHHGCDLVDREAEEIKICRSLTLASRVSVVPSPKNEISSPSSRIPLTPVAEG